MKILDIPQSGKKGLDVSLGGRYGQFKRRLVIPANPRTTGQPSVRQHFAALPQPASAPRPTLPRQRFS